MNGLARWDGSDFQSVGGGLNGSVGALLPTNQGLFVGGDFTTAGGQPIAGIARWDGSTWHSIAEGVGLGGVNALLMFNGDLIAAGNFTTAGNQSVNRIARWDGSQWHAMHDGFNQPVRNVVVFNGELYASGHFTASGDRPVNRIARWDGQKWQPLGDGLTGGFPNAMKVHDGRLYVGGTFTYAGGMYSDSFASWDGASWQAQPGPLNNPTDLVIYQGHLIAIGSVQLKRWTGTSWEEFADGFSRTAFVGLVHGDDLYIGGDMPTVGQTPLSGIARWDGTQWRRIGPSVGTNGTVWHLSSHNEFLVAGGAFTMIGGQPAFGIAIFDGTSWQALGSGVGGNPFGVFVRASLSFRGDLIVAGNFTIAGGQQVNQIARWDGAQWHPMGTGISALTLYALSEFQGNLYAAGFGGVSRWNGDQWQHIGATNEPVEALIVYDGELLAGGKFTTIGGKPIAGLARWDGVSWKPFRQPIWGHPNRFVVYRGDLIATSVAVPDGPPPPSAGIARWDGTAWHHLGMGNIGVIYDIAVHDDMIVVCGSFLNAQGTAAKRIARWDGQSWIPIGSGLNGWGTALATFQGDLFVGGIFTTAGDELAVHLARATLKWKAGDFNCDGIVGVADLLAVISNWGPCPAPPQACPADIAPPGGDGTVGVADLLMVINNWG